MTDTAQHAFTTSYTTTDGTRFDITADRGTQAVGFSTGNPLPMTDPGTGALGITGPTGEAITVRLTPGVISMLRSLLLAAEGIMDSRDPALDQRPPRD